MTSDEIDKLEKTSLTYALADVWVPEDDVVLEIFDSDSDSDSAHSGYAYETIPNTILRKLRRMGWGYCFGSNSDGDLTFANADKGKIEVAATGPIDNFSIAVARLFLKIVEIEKAEKANKAEKVNK